MATGAALLASRFCCSSHQFSKASHSNKDVSSRLHEGSPHLALFTFESRSLHHPSVKVLFEDRLELRHDPLHNALDGGRVAVQGVLLNGGRIRIR